MLLRMGITRSHFLPIQHLIAGGDHGQQTFGVCALGGCVKPLQPRTHIQGLQLINETRVKVNTVFGVVPTGVLADVVRQVTRGVHGGVEQHT